LYCSRKQTYRVIEAPAMILNHAEHVRGIEVRRIEPKHVLVAFSRFEQSATNLRRESQVNEI